jgi:3-(3-hydroxy-phenyl)propionate hydroxylase
MSTTLFPIVVVGAGPVGLSVALGLLRAGYHVIVFEQRAKIPKDPRATTLQPPTLEMLESLGILETVAALGRRVDALDYWAFDHGRRERLASLPMAALSDDTAYPYRLHVAQPDLCAALLAAVEGEVVGTVHFAQKVVGLTDKGDCVDVEVKQGGRVRRIRAAWVCGADGLSSGTRKHLDLPMRRLTRSDVFFTGEAPLQIDAAIEGRHGVRLGDASFLYTDAGWALFMRMRESVRLLLAAEALETGIPDSASLLAMASELVGEETLRIENRGVYTVQQQVAESWRKGRVLVLGDAAHSTYPVSGTAMNSGIHDGYTLSQALQRDEEGVAGWERSRRQEVHERVNAYANKTYKALHATGLFSRLSRDRYLRRLATDEKAARAHLLRASMLEGRAGKPPALTET